MLSLPLWCFLDSNSLYIILFLRFQIIFVLFCFDLYLDDYSVVDILLIFPVISPFFNLSLSLFLFLILLLLHAASLSHLTYSVLPLFSALFPCCIIIPNSHIFSFPLLPLKPLIVCLCIAVFTLIRLFSDVGLACLFIFSTGLVSIVSHSFSFRSSAVSR